MLKVLLTNTGPHFDFICVTMSGPPLEDSGYRSVNADNITNFYIYYRISDSEFIGYLTASRFYTYSPHYLPIATSCMCIDS